MKATLAISEIKDFQDLYEEVKDLEDVDPELLQALEDGQSIVENQGVIETTYLNASDKQIHFADLVKRRKIRVGAACGANRSGKTTTTVDMCAALYLREFALDGSVVWCISQNWKKSVLGLQQQFWRALPHDRFTKKWNAEFGFGHRGLVRFKTRDEGHAHIVFYNEEMALNVFETDAVNFVVWDEATKESILGRLRSRVVDRQGIILISCLPEHIWLKFRIEKSDNPEWFFSQFTTYDNEHNLPPGEIEKMAQDMTPEERALRVHGEFVQMSGVILKEFSPILRPDGHLCEDFKVPADWPVWVYIDVGEYTGATLLTVDPDGHRYVADEVYTLGKRVDENAAEIEMMLARHDRKVSQVEVFKMDPAAWAFTAANEVTIGDQYSNAGIPCTRWTRTQEMGFKASVNMLRLDYARDRLSVCERCEHLSHEQQVWRWRMDDQQRIDMREKPDVGPDHLIDTVRAWVCDDPQYDVGELVIIDTAPDLDM
tara:strand:+ start:1259 stop:2716 length:1458 start_codon:yes stop_codon:yes gene_type:complete